MVNKEQRVPDIARFSPLPDPASTPDVLLAHSQEYHTSTWGHLGLLGLDDHYLVPGFVAYPYTGAASPYPDNAAVADLAHAQHALVGYVHPFDTAPDPHRDKTIMNALPVDVALGKVDYYETVGFSNHRESAAIWYRLLDCGFRLPAAGGTDAMTNYASLRGPVGLARTYVLPDPPADASSIARERAWLAGLKVGRSVATNGPLIGLTAGDAAPGGEIALAQAGEGRGQGLAALARAGRPPGDRAERQGGEIDRACGRAHASGLRRKRPYRRERLAAVARLERACDAGRLRSLSLCHDQPVYVTVGGAPARSKEDAGFFLAWIAKLRSAAGASRDYNTKAERDAVLAHIDEARRVFEARR